MAVFPGFCERTNRTLSFDWAIDRCVNWIPQRAEVGTEKSQMMLQRPPGLGSGFTLATSPVRCLWAGDDRLFFVAGAKYGEVGGSTFTVASDSNNATIDALTAGSANMLLIYSAGKAYYDIGAGAVEIGNAASATVMDGYGILLVRNAVSGADEIFVSDYFDFTSWDPLKFQQAVATPDRAMRIMNFDGRLWIWKKRSMEAWYNSGNADFPFQLDKSSVVNWGTEYPDTICVCDWSLFFLGNDDHGGGEVFRTRGFSRERVSDYGIASAILDVGGQPVAFSYSEDGHTFYVLNFIGASGDVPALVYDVTEDRWHERGSWNGTGFSPYLGRCHVVPTKGYATYGGLHLVGSHSSGKVLVQGYSHNTYDGTAIRQNRRVGFPAAENKLQYHHRIEFEVETGDYSVTPTALLKWSENGGRSFGTEHTLTLGASGDYTKRAYKQRLGKTRGRRVYDLTLPATTAPVGITGAAIEVTEGTS